MGIGTFGSRSAQLAGSAIVVAADRLIEKGRQIAAHMMEAAEHDIVFEKGRFAIAGTDRSVGIARGGAGVVRPDGAAGRHRDRVFRAREYSARRLATFPSGCHICEVEIDQETGEVELTALFRGRRCRRAC